MGLPYIRAKAQDYYEELGEACTIQRPTPFVDNEGNQLTPQYDLVDHIMSSIEKLSIDFWDVDIDKLAFNIFVDFNTKSRQGVGVDDKA